MTLTLVVFLLVYVAMGAGQVPGFKVDRTGAAIIGALVLIAAGRIAPQAAWVRSTTAPSASSSVSWSFRPPSSFRASTGGPPIASRPCPSRLRSFSRSSSPSADCCLRC